MVSVKKADSGFATLLLLSVKYSFGSKVQTGVMWWNQKLKLSNGSCFIFHTRKTLRKYFNVNKLSNIWKSQLIKLKFENFNFIKLSRIFFFGRRPQSASCYSVYVLNCLFLLRVCLELFYTTTLFLTSFNLLYNYLFN